jgi:parallel beta-helix repeat protein
MRLALSLVLAAALGGLGLAGRAAAAPRMGVTCGDTINAPGHYFLTGNCGPYGIVINASDVKLRLDGHTMTGDGDGEGVDVFGSRVTIEGPGTITNWDDAILIEGGKKQRRIHVIGTRDNSNGVGIGDSPGETGNKFVDNTTNGNFIGIVLSATGSKLVDNTANRNQNTGILVGGTDNKIVANTANRNAFGIEVGATDSKIHGNTALGNSSFDLSDDNPGCDNNDWSDNHFVTSNLSCIH